MVRLQSELLAQIDAWRRTEADLPSRAEALRRLASQALKRGRVDAYVGTKRNWP
jgi:hypothetical protein